jgi:hypothetical protein
MPQEGIGVAQNAVAHFLKHTVVDGNDPGHRGTVVHSLQIRWLSFQPSVPRLQNAFNRVPSHGKVMPDFVAIS